MLKINSISSHVMIYETFDQCYFDSIKVKSVFPFIIEYTQHSNFYANSKECVINTHINLNDSVYIIPNGNAGYHMKYRGVKYINKIPHIILRNCKNKDKYCIPLIGDNIIGLFKYKRIYFNKKKIRPYIWWYHTRYSISKIIGQSIIDNDIVMGLFYLNSNPEKLFPFVSIRYSLSDLEK